MKSFKKLKSFTLADVMIVFTIIGIIAVFGIKVSKDRVTYYMNNFMYYYGFENLIDGVGEILANGCTAEDVEASHAYCTATSGVLPIIGHTAADSTGLSRGFCDRMVDMFNTISTNDNCESASEITDENALFTTYTPNFVTSNGMKFYNFTTAPIDTDSDTVLDTYIVYIDIDGNQRKGQLNTDVMKFKISVSGGTVTPDATSEGANNVEYLSSSVRYLDTNNQYQFVTGAVSITYLRAVCIATGVYDGTASNCASADITTYENNCVSNTCSVLKNKPGFTLFKL